jgi:hypothetical protein
MGVINNLIKQLIFVLVIFLAVPRCPPLKDIPLTRRSNRDNKVDTFTTFACKFPYEKKSGDTARLCGRDKKWTGTDLKCKRK